MLVVLFVGLRGVPWGVGFRSLQPWQTQRGVLTPCQAARPQFPATAVLQQSPECYPGENLTVWDPLHCQAVENTGSGGVNVLLDKGARKRNFQNSSHTPILPQMCEYNVAGEA